MGREVKRVALDFVWPLSKVWKGFIMPENLRASDCTRCGGTGYSEHSKRLSDRWYGYAPFRPENRGSWPYDGTTPAVRAFAERNVERSPDFYGVSPSRRAEAIFRDKSLEEYYDALLEAVIVREATRLANMWNKQWSHHLNQDDVDVLVEAGRLHDLTSRWDTTERKWIPTGHHPTAAEVNDWSMRGMGHDSINQWIVVKAECRRLGVPESCNICDGAGEMYADVGHKEAHDAWEPTEPPAGEGWQMWETTSEGSPITPVFATPEEVANYLVAHYPEDATFDQWMKMMRGAGWAPSGMMIDGVYMTGVAGMGIED